MSHTETEIGTVLEVHAGRARVEVSPTGLCSRCELASSCMPAASGTRIIEVADPIGVSVNQKVRIDLSSGTLLLASFLAYILPLSCLLAGAFLGFYTTRSASKELWSGAGALAGLAAGLLASRLADRRLGRRGKLTPTIAQVVAPEDKENFEDEN